MSIDGTVVLFFEITILSKMLLKFDILLNITRNYGPSGLLLVPASRGNTL